MEADIAIFSQSMETMKGLIETLVERLDKCKTYFNEEEESAKGEKTLISKPLFIVEAKIEILPFKGEVDAESLTIVWHNWRANKYYLVKGEKSFMFYTYGGKEQP
ncbi:hypothetical protein SUGI_0991450 [Cryptomeria japonica]|nr:hypothetical protein SUGI_0991450 [Cryptomeria japonica]